MQKKDMRVGHIIGRLTWPRPQRADYGLVVLFAVTIAVVLVVIVSIDPDLLPPLAHP